MQTTIAGIGLNLKLKHCFNGLLQWLLYGKQREAAVDGRFRQGDEAGVPERQAAAARHARPLALLLLGPAQKGGTGTTRFGRPFLRRRATYGVGTACRRG